MFTQIKPVLYFFFFFQCRAFFSGTADPIPKIFDTMMVSGKWTWMTPKSLRCIPYLGGCPQKYVEHHSNLRRHHGFSAPLSNRWPNFKSKQLAYNGDDGENCKEIGWGIAEKRFPKNTSFFGVYNYAWINAAAAAQCTWRPVGCRAPALYSRSIISSLSIYSLLCLLNCVVVNRSVRTWICIRFPCCIR